MRQTFELLAIHNMRGEKPKRLNTSNFLASTKFLQQMNKMKLVFWKPFFLICEVANFEAHLGCSSWSQYVM